MALSLKNPLRTIAEIIIVDDAARDIERPIERISHIVVPSDTVSLARFLLGKVLVRELPGGIAAGRIVETEAYLPDDPACHAFRGVTPRNRSLFLERGHAYVYLCYGTSYMLNVSSEAAGIGAGVLLRALEPLYGIEHMRRNAKPIKSMDLARGPGRLAAALRVDLRQDGLDLLAAEQLWIGTDNRVPGPVGCGVRIGISKAADQRLRFFIAGNRHVSGPRRLNT
jgi:DNA-3-methyladenine glycosylase